MVYLVLSFGLSVLVVAARVAKYGSMAWVLLCPTASVMLRARTVDRRRMIKARGTSVG